MSSEKDKSELDKYIKFFCLKTIELIYSCRQKNTGPVLQNVDPNSRPWFNIQTPEVPEVGKEAKRVLDKQLPSPQKSLIIQTYIHLPPNNKTVIEAWKISSSDECDKNVKLITGVYAKLATLLKSILCVSRTTAAYKFCRENKTFKVETEFYFGEVSSALLDDVCDKPRRLGTVATPFSSLSVTVFCRHIKQIENLVSNQRQKSSLVNSANEPTVQNQRNLSAADKLASDSSTEFQPPRKVPEYPITPAFAVQAEKNSKDLLFETPFEQFFAETSHDFLRPDQESLRTNDIVSAQSNEYLNRFKQQQPPFLTRVGSGTGSNRSSVSSRKNSNSRPGSLTEMSQPAFISPTDSVSSHQKTDSNCSSADNETDVSQFFRVVQQASCLRSNEPQEGQVISHNMQLGDYVTSFNDIGDELKKLTTVLND